MAISVQSLLVVATEASFSSSCPDTPCVTYTCKLDDIDIGEAGVQCISAALLFVIYPDVPPVNAPPSLTSYSPPAVPPQ